MLIRNWLKSLKAVRSHPYRPAFALFFSDKRVISATDEPSTTKFDSIMHSEDVLKDDSTKDEELHPHWSSMGIQEHVTSFFV